MKLITKLIMHNGKKTCYDLYTETNVWLGKLDRLEDGYFTFLQDKESGYMSSFNLRLIADKIDELNKDWDLQVTNDLRAIEIANFLHDTYEEVAKEKKWNTQENCKVEFDDLPNENKETMLEVAKRLDAWITK